MVSQLDASLVIGEKKVGIGHPVFVIAEIGINHDGHFERAKELILEAKNAGATAAKLQTYITEKRTGKDSPIYEILKQCELTFQEQRQLFDYARDIDILLFSTPFDDESVDFLHEVDSPCIKVASFDVVNRELLKKITRTRKPVIVSRGMAATHELDTAAGIMKTADLPFALLHCVSAYPVENHEDCNLRTIPALQKRYLCPVGFSDHTIGNRVTQLAVATGASLIEKHVTYSRKAKGADHAMSMEFGELKKLVNELRYVTEALGQEISGPIEAEAGITQFRRIT